MEWLLENSWLVVEVATSIVGVFALIATATKNSTDNKVADVLLKIINFLGANWGQAANRDDE